VLNNDRIATVLQSNFYYHRAADGDSTCKGGTSPSLSLAMIRKLISSKMKEEGGAAEYDRMVLLLVGTTDVMSVSELAITTGLDDVTIMKSVLTLLGQGLMAMSSDFLCVK
jgi:hypothetical protein